MASVQDERQQPTMTVEQQYQQGFEYRCRGEYGLAKEALNEVLRLDPSHIKAKWQLALIKGFEGDYDGSLEGLREVATLAPDDTEIRYDYAMTLTMLGEYALAESEFREVLRMNPNHDKAKQQLAYFK
ncbi:MAG: hypothetical protein AKCLJLPJ_00898 [Fimbriimonadales bacterium]|nr:MAG: hypothetical protein EDM73_04225 [Armatimonadota bacterium]MBV6502842.1 hypothetical protein [Fimbriimonadales bacterium]MCE7899197.1 hypothetical protein [Armatimonadetes bacterium ATM1]MDL1928980.1 tetratricopeptide repeat protein [Fimbriimonadia bacterium ATM]MBC6969465.1 hypothetical protein [Armatimonadota bacterium]